MSLSIKSDDLQRLIQTSDLPLLIYFYGSWCPPCRRMGPEFEAIASELEGLYKFVKVVIDEAEEVALSYRISVIPTTVFIKDGQEVGRLVGFRTRNELRDYMAKAFK